MDFTSSSGAADDRQDGKGLLRSNLWFSNDLASLWDERVGRKILRNRLN